MGLNRLAISLLIGLYLAGSLIAGFTVATELTIAVAIYAALSVGLLAHMLARPTAYRGRRVLAVFIDLGMLSYGMHAGDTVATLFYPIYLWVVLGNGFRFGLAYLFLSMGVAITGFAALVATSDSWRDHLHLAAGLMLGLIVIPLYAATLIRKLSTALAQAKQASQAKSMFLASVSHELRTPLNAIIGLSDLLRDSPLDAEQKDMTKTIGAAGRSLLTLINSILDFSRIEAGRMPSSIVAFDLHSLVAEIRAMLAVQAQAKGLRLATHITTRTPFMLRGDKRHLEEILINLAANAVKFTESGHVVISVDEVERGGAKARLRFEVCDTGIGIAREAQERIFESFSQADETIIDRFGGTGLGLAIVKQLVEMQGGKIGVESAPGAGSTFWFEIAFEMQAEAEQPKLANAPVILISADAELEGRLRALGAEPRLARDAAQAAALAADPRDAQAPRPVVIVDESFAGRDLERLGRELVGPARACPLVLLRGDAAAEPSYGALRVLFATEIARSFDAPALATALRIACGRIDSERAGEAAAGAVATRTLSILVAEDNRTNQRVIAKILERTGHRVMLVENGELALDALEQHTFDLVLMDINMPVMNGLEATKVYRVMSLGEKHIPIVALTADATEEISRRCEEAGMDACLTKPIEPAHLLDTIMKLVPASAATQETAVAEAPTTGEAHAEPEEPVEAAEPVEEAQVVDQRTLDALAELGGKEFVNELVGQFVGDAASVLRDLAAAARDGDAQSFREQAHALRSAAANIGAKRIYEVCLSWRQMPADDLARNGAQYLERLKAEFDEVRAALHEHLPAAPESKPRSAAPLKVIRGGRDTALAS